MKYLILLTLLACSEKGPLLFEKTGPLVQESKILGFKTLNSQLLIRTCATTGCHDDSAAGGYRLESYEDYLQGNLIIPGKPNESLIIKVIENNSMPKNQPPFSDEMKKTIRNWVKFGAKKEDQDLVKVPGFDTLFDRFISQSCSTTGCHDNSMAGGYRILTYEDMFELDLVIPRKVEESVLWDVIRNDYMPRGRAALTTEQKEVISLWIENGAPREDFLVVGEAPEPVPTPMPTPTPVAVKGFKTLKVEFLDQFCARCHDKDVPILVNFEDYVDGDIVIPGNVQNSYLWEVISSDYMPKGERKLSAEMKADIKVWIEAGAPREDIAL